MRRLFSCALCCQCGRISHPPKVAATRSFWAAVALFLRLLSRQRSSRDLPSLRGFHRRCARSGGQQMSRQRQRRGFSVWRRNHWSGRKREEAAQRQKLPVAWVPPERGKYPDEGRRRALLETIAARKATGLRQGNENRRAGAAYLRAFISSRIICVMRSCGQGQCLARRTSHSRRPAHRRPERRMSGAAY